VDQEKNWEYYRLSLLLLHQGLIKDGDSIQDHITLIGAGKFNQAFIFHPNISDIKPPLTGDERKRWALKNGKKIFKLRKETKQHKYLFRDLVVQELIARFKNQSGMTA